ncbi:hypothetical protein [Coxiella-like endosymbiont of Rhipicephalus sanguineus]|uniref:hypothetical protein n=1 Tax=Coxiella-like endosymbiont of Rhipicephalus sanguineus TaxID=1955402 RepID=UPI0020421F16|nr:hypothetical protein [Coxiella-like endosymbiont of Rhipicephalus sanguineus]
MDPILMHLTLIVNVETLPLNDNADTIRSYIARYGGKQNPSENKMNFSLSKQVF